MLREPDGIAMEEPVTAPAAALAMPAPWVPATGSSGRYGQAKRANMPAMIVTIALHVVLIAVLLTVRQHFVKKAEAKLTVVNLTPAPPPPQNQPEPPKPQQTPVIAPRPVVQLNMPVVNPVPTTPDPVPPQPMPPTNAAPTPAPPSPPAPPSVIQDTELGSRMVSGKPPSYPMDSRRKHEEGTVVLTLTLGVDGAVSTIAISRSSGFARLDKAALEAVSRWRWAPIMRDGRAVMVKGLVEIPFVLQS